MASVSDILCEETGGTDRHIYNRNGIFFEEEILTPFQTIPIDFEQLVNQMQDQKSGQVMKLYQGEWKFWLIQVIWEGKGNSYHLDPLISVGCIDNLHKYCNTMPEPSEIKLLPTKKVSIAFFRNNLKPAWEEEENKGRVVYECSADLVNYAWQQLIWMCCNGDFNFGSKPDSDKSKSEASEPTPEDDKRGAGLVVNGVVVGPSRKKTDNKESIYTLEIWATDPDLNSRDPCRSRDLLKERLKKASDDLRKKKKEEVDPQDPYVRLNEVWEKTNESKRFKSREANKDKH